MNVQSPSPSRLLVLMAFVARWLLGLVLAIWFVLLASWGVLHGWIVPRIETYRPTLERQATRILGVPVRIGSISAETVGLMPSFELQDVALYDPQGNVALRLPRVAAVLSPRSIWNLGFEQLYIDAPVLDVRRARDGKIFVAVLDLGGGGAGDHSAERWFFSQTEFVIHEGQLRWTDEQRGVEPLALSHVSVLVRNTARRHAVHLDAALPPEWGGHFSADARFRQPLLSLSTGNWQDWEGQVFANFDQVDVSRLRHYADLGLNVDQGKGSLRLWADLARGQLTGATADMALLQVRARLNTQSETLTLRAITGRLGGKRLPQGFEFSTQNLQFVMTDGRRWPGGNVNVVLKTGDPKQASMPALGELHADQLDLAALGQMANLLPLGTATHAAIKAYALQGLVEKLDAHWQGQLSAPTQFDAKGRVSGFQAAAGSAFVEPATATASKHIHPGRPGVVGATADFDLTQAGGTAKLAIQDRKSVV